MSHLARLRRLTDAGELDAARELRRSAVQAADPDDALRAAVALDDLELMAELLVGALDAGDGRFVARVATELGIEVAPDEMVNLAEGLRRLMAQGNATHTHGRCTRETLLVVAGECVRSGSKLAWRCAGTEATGEAAYVMAVGLPDERGHGARRLVLATARGPTAPMSPAGAFGGLTRWGESLADDVARVRAWASHLPPATARLDLPIAPAWRDVRVPPGFDEALVVLAPVLLTRPDRAAFVTLLQQLERADEALIAQVEAWLAVHWPVSACSPSVTQLGELIETPTAPRWRLVRHLDLGSLHPRWPPERLVRVLTRSTADRIARLTWPFPAPDLLVELLSLDAMASVDTIALGNRALPGTSGWHRVFETTVWTHLDDLRLALPLTAAGTRIHRAAIAAIARAERLRSLRLRDEALHGADTPDLLDAIAGVGLEHLWIDIERSHGGLFVKRLAQHPAADRLRTLVARRQDLGHDAALMLARSPQLAQLEALDVSYNPRVRPTGVVELVGSPTRTRLRHLDARGCVSRPVHLTPLLEMPGLARFETLRLRPCMEPDRLIDLLWASPTLRVDPASVVSEQGLELPD